MGAIKVHEFMTLDGIIENPSWTMEFGFDPRMGDAIAALMGDSNAILLGRKTYEMFAPAWSTRTVDDDPGAVLQRHRQVRRVLESHPHRLVELHRAGRLRPGHDPDAQGEGRRHRLRQRKRDAGPSPARGRAGRLAAPVHLTVTRGSGQRLFTDDTAGLSLSLIESDTYDNGVVHLAYAQTDAGC